MKNPLKSVTIALLVLLALILSGIAAQQPERETPRTRTKAAAETAPMEQGTTVASDTGSVPEGFPDLPVYPGAVLESATAEEPYYRARWQAPEQVPVVVAWYMGEYFNMGWYLTALPGDPASDTLQAFTAAKDGNTATLTVSSGGAGAGISVEVHADNGTDGMSH
jgi:hypothetical protein